MKDRLFAFQSTAVRELLQKSEYALKAYRETAVPQVISLQAPTGAGKTVMLISFIENVLFGSEETPDRPDAVFVWLSDSPQLNEQSKNKFLKSDRIRYSQLVTIEEASFDRQTLEDGKIYFLNTQKIGSRTRLSQRGDARCWTIWETLANTAREKSDRFYFIIDEAHRGSQGTEAGKATSIMQRFIKGSAEWGLDRPMPLVIGISATPERFNALVGTTSSTQSHVYVRPDEVRASGLLKKRIVITYPEDLGNDFSDMSVLKAASAEWMEKTRHWRDYCTVQHEKTVIPAFIVQVKAGSSSSVSATDLDEVIATIEQTTGMRFTNGQVVHTFGDARSIVANGLKINRMEPSEISDDRNVLVVLAKEAISTGWDCPRAETMMSFRVAEDSTYIAQLLGRMVRSPLGREVQSDDTLNDVRLFVPNFNRANVDRIIRELQSPECGDIPAFISGEALNPGPRRSHTVNWPVIDPEVAPYLPENDGENRQEGQEHDIGAGFDRNTYEPVPDPVSPPDIVPTPHREPRRTRTADTGPGPDLTDLAIDRRGIEAFINNGNFVTYTVRHARIRDYLPSLFEMVSFLARNGIDRQAKEDLDRQLLQDIRSYVEGIRASGRYETVVKENLALKLRSNTFDIFGASMTEGRQYVLLGNSELDRFVGLFDRSYGSYGLPYMYGREFPDDGNPDAYKTDLVVYDANKSNRERLETMARQRLYELDDRYRLIVHQKLPESAASQYDRIISNSDEITRHAFILPEKADLSENPNGKEYTDHLFVREDTGSWKVKLNSWEEKTLEEERRRSDFVCWYRNPSNAGYSLTIPYVYNRVNRPMHPDFLIIRSHPVVRYVIDILEPHMPALDDNLPKAQGLAEYAERHPVYGRIQLIRETDDGTGRKRLVRLDFCRREIREKVRAMTTPEQLTALFMSEGTTEG